jgi:hypothetical protein
LPAGLVSGGLSPLLPHVVVAADLSAAARYTGPGQVLLGAEPAELKLLS